LIRRRDNEVLQNSRNSEIHPVSYSMGNRDTVHGGKAAGAWRWTPSSAKVNNKWSYNTYLFPFISLRSLHRYGFVSVSQARIS
jgi:hypothetical protein